MTRKFLQFVGALTVLAILGAGAVAIFFVKQRFVVTVTDEATTQKAGPSPLSLLSDDVAALRADLGSLTAALSKNFETLAAQGEERDVARARALDARLAQTSSALATLSERLAAAVATNAEAEAKADAARRDGLAGLASLRTAVDQLAAERGSAPAAVSPAPRAADLSASSAAPPPTGVLAPIPPATTPPTTSAAALPAPARAGSARPAPDAAMAPPPLAPAPPPPAPPTSSPAPAASAATPAAGGAVSGGPAPPRKKGFLSFALPSESLDFTQRLRFEIVPSLSRVGFDAKSTLHDFSGVTSEVGGSFTARLAQPGDGISGLLKAEAATLDTKEPDRDVEMRRALDTTRFPTIDFALTSFEVSSVDPKTLASSGTARGKLTIHGVTHDAAVPLRISVDGSRRVLVDGETPLRLTDYGVVPPSKAGLIKVDDQVKIWLSLRARATGKAE